MTGASLLFTLLFVGRAPLGLGDFEGEASVGQGFGLDDLNRFRVGGENPYVVPLAKAGWAGWPPRRRAVGILLGLPRRGCKSKMRMSIVFGVRGQDVRRRDLPCADEGTTRRRAAS